MEQTWTVEALAVVVSESALWREVVAAADNAFGIEVSPEACKQFVEGIDIGWCKEYEPFHEPLRALLAEIRSGAIYGSAEKCSCGSGKADGWMCGAEHHVYYCARCLAALEESMVKCSSSTAAAIVRTSRILAQSGEKREEEKPPVEKTITVLEPWQGSPSSCAICGHGPASPTAPFVSFLCWGETGVRPESSVDMHICERAWMEGCNTEQTDDPRENERRIVVRAHEWYEANVERERPYTAQIVREASVAFKAWRMGQTGIATGVYAASETTRERLRRMVCEIKWYEKNVEGKRGPDPRLLLMGDVFDPRVKR